MMDSLLLDPAPDGSSTNPQAPSAGASLPATAAGLLGDGNTSTGSSLLHNGVAPALAPSSPIPSVMAPPLGPALYLTPEQVVGNVVRLAKSHSGSRFVQQKLDSGDPVFYSIFFNEMKDHVGEMMVDNFAHFAIEKLIALANREQCAVLCRALAPNFTSVACQKHGSFSVQALVDTIADKPDLHRILVDALAPEIVSMMTHTSGHFVVLRLLQKFPYSVTQFIDQAIQNNCLVVGTDHHGLRVVKAILTLRRPSELIQLFKHISRLTMKLVSNQYGNYVIQSLLDVGNAGVRTNIKVKMEGKYMRLSKQKFSSNVVEKCLKESSSHWRSIIIRELTAQPGVADLLRDRYGPSPIEAWASCCVCSSPVTAPRRATRARAPRP